MLSRKEKILKKLFLALRASLLSILFSFFLPYKKKHILEGDVKKYSHVSKFIWPPLTRIISTRTLCALLSLNLRHFKKSLFTPVTRFVDF